MEEELQRLRMSGRRTSQWPGRAATCPGPSPVLQHLQQLRLDLCCQGGECGASLSGRGQYLYPLAHHIRTKKGSKTQRWDFYQWINGEVSKIKSLLTEISGSDTFMGERELVQMIVFQARR